MSLSEFEIKQCEKELDQFLKEHRPPIHIRDKVDLAYRISGQSVEIFEVRPAFQDQDKKIEIPVAKARYVKTQRHWLIYWHRADMKWHKYPPFPEAKNIKQFLKVVGEDEHHCFFG